MIHPLIFSILSINCLLQPLSIDKSTSNPFQMIARQAVFIGSYAIRHPQIVRHVHFTRIIRASNQRAFNLSGRNSKDRFDTGAILLLVGFH
jgi:hypothetical protein